MHKNCVILKYNIIPLISHPWDHAAIRLSSTQIFRLYICIYSLKFPWADSHVKMWWFSRA